MNKAPLATTARKRLGGILPMSLYKKHPKKVNPILKKELQILLEKDIFVTGFGSISKNKDVGWIWEILHPKS